MSELKKRQHSEEDMSEEGEDDVDDDMDGSNMDDKRK
jgi:hypothetical protein